MRGIESHGMLLAADYRDADGNDRVEPLEAPDAVPGTKVVLEGSDPKFEKPQEISADDFFKVRIDVVDGKVMVGGVKLCVDGKAIETKFTKNGEVH